MRRIFTVELSSEHKPGGLRCTELTLPAQPWALFDALDKLQAEDGTKITTEICQYYTHEHLAPVIQNSPDLYELNALALRLSALSAPVIKCKKTPGKKCSFVAERRKKR